MAGAKIGTLHEYTVVKSVALSFAGLLSPCVVTVAVLVTLGSVALSTLTVSVIVLLVTAAIGPLYVQLTIWPLAEHVHPAPLAETKLKPAGKLSVTVVGPVVLPMPTL